MKKVNYGVIRVRTPALRRASFEYTLRPRGMCHSDVITVQIDPGALTASMSDTEYVLASASA